MLKILKGIETGWRSILWHLVPAIFISTTYLCVNKVKTDFLRAISHELKTPATAVSVIMDNMIFGVGKYKNYDEWLPIYIVQIYIVQICRLFLTIILKSKCPILSVK